MSDDTTARATPNIVERAKAILIRPKDEWQTIAGETTTVAGLYRNYIIFLAAVPAVAIFLRSVLFGHGNSLFSHRPGFVASLIEAAMQYGLALVGVAVLVFISNAVAKKFGGQGNQLNAFKLITYGMTAGWLAGGFELIPGLGWLSILGVYSFYLVYLGLPVLLQVPQDRAFIATLSIGIVTVIAFAAGTAILSPLGRFIAPDTHRTSQIETTIPGMLGVDTDNIENSAQRMEEAATKARANPVTAQQLETFLPEELSGYSRDNFSSTSMGMGEGGRVSTVRATYRKGEDHLEVSLVDMGDAGAMAQMGAALGINSERRTSDGFERIFIEDGHMVTEKWNETSKRGSYSFTLADRFSISVEGNGDELSDLKELAKALDLDRLTDLAG